MVIRKCFFLKFDNIDIVFCLVLRYIDIRGTEKADSAMELLLAKVGLLCNDFKHTINHYILSTWQDD